MGKKKSRTVAKKGPPLRVATVFDCPRCSHGNSVEVKLKRTQKEAFLSCRVCKVKHRAKINSL
jgi:transcription elongation factor Elf1